ncbi:MAG TPA: response regulator transcription factor [Mycobacterium sp.]|nr:response regulator transcription factor [Mycobacterium sp.]
MTKSDRVRVVVGDDHPVYRDGLVHALDNNGRTEVVVAVGDGRAALDAIREHSPDVALLDYKMPGLDGIAVAHAVVRDKLPTRVLLVSATTEGKSVPDMAAELYLAQTTIKTHIRRLYEKLGVSDRGAAVAQAMRNHMLE